MDDDAKGVSVLDTHEMLLPLAHFEGARDLPRALFLREVLRRPHSVVASARAEREGEPLSIEEVGKVGEAVQVSIDDRGVREALFEVDERPVLLTRRHTGDLDVSVAAVESSPAREQAELLAGQIGVERKPQDPRVSVAFWSGSGDALSGPDARWRRLELPRFADVEGNYPVAVRQSLGEMFARSSGHAFPGRLALWHGPPGTGKTWALRALGREWSDWCDLHYITDPERLLGGDTGYMLGVLAARSDPSGHDIDDYDEPAPRRRDDRSERWRLLVLEDAGELLEIGAPAEVGRGFARLLNIADGLLGQGTRALILVTTNEPLGKLHPAALRPGRAMSTIEFAPLDGAEATAWLRDRDLDQAIDAPATIAELHAILAGSSTPAPAPASVGFS